MDDRHQGGDDDSHVAIDTGRRGQRLVLEGWFASHADSGTPGPHVHLRTSDGETAVVRTDQVPRLIESLTKVARRIDDQWATHGDSYAAEVVLHSPDPQDPIVAEEQRQKRLRFTQAVLDNLAEVMRRLTDAASTDEALISVAALLQVDEVDVMGGLARFDLLTLTQPATERRLAAMEKDQA
jgi:hypothetical protein